MSWQDVAHMVAAGKGASAVPFIGVPDATEGDLQKATDIGALGIMVPMVDTVEKAEKRAANGMRMNYRAARRGRSYAEFKAKLGVVFEEADEAADWLRYFRDTGMRHDRALVREGEELASIVAASVATARKTVAVGRTTQTASCT